MAIRSGDAAWRPSDVVCLIRICAEEMQRTDPAAYEAFVAQVKQELDFAIGVY